MVNFGQIWGQLKVKKCWWPYSLEFNEILYCSWSTIKPNISLDLRSFSNILNGVSHEMKWAMKLSRFSWRRFESCFLNFEAKVCHVKTNFILTIWTSKFKNHIGQISVEKIKMTFLRQVQSLNNLLKRFKTKVALFVTVHNDSIFVKCSNIFDQLFDRILEWVNQTDPLEMEFSKFELVFEKLVQVSFSSKLKRDYSNDFVLSHFTDRDWVLMTPSWWGSQ